MIADAQNGIAPKPDWLDAYDDISADLGKACTKSDAIANINALIGYLEKERDWIQDCEG